MAENISGGPVYPTDYAHQVEGISRLEWYAGQVLPSLQSTAGNMPMEEIERIGRAAGYTGSIDGFIAIRAFQIAEAMVAEAKRRR